MAALAIPLSSEAPVALFGSLLHGLPERLSVAKAPWPEGVIVRDAFFVKSRDRLFKINCAEVLAIEATKEYSLLRTANAG